MKKVLREHKDGAFLMNQQNPIIATSTQMSTSWKNVRLE